MSGDAHGKILIKNQLANNGHEIEQLSLSDEKIDINLLTVAKYIYTQEQNGEKNLGEMLHLIEKIASFVGAHSDSSSPTVIAEPAPLAQITAASI